MNVSIVTASDLNYFVTLTELLRSLRGIDRFGHFRIHVLDVGLSEQQRQDLKDAGYAVLSPGWDVDVSHLQGVQEWFRAMTARPFLPNYVQADIIFWIDADVWVQDQEMMYDYVRAAGKGDFAVCLEIDRSYDNIFMRNQSREVYYNDLVKCFGEDNAAMLIHMPMMNSGVFALASDSRVWSAWQDTAKSAMKNHYSLFVEQTALNMAVYSANILPHFLPARYNWMTCHATPALDEAARVFVEPRLPHDKIGLVHLACGLWKRNDIQYRTTDGKIWKGPLRLQRTTEAGEAGRSVSSATPLGL